MLAIVVGLFLGTGVWVVVDMVQTRAIQQLFEEELQKRLEQQARESLVRFNHFVEQYTSMARLLAHHKTLAQYLSPLFWGSDEMFFKMTYRSEPPDWLPGPLLWQSLTRPSHLLLIDRHGKIREEYQLDQEPLSAELKELVHWEADISRSFLTEVSGYPYLIIIEETEDESDNVMGALVLIVPIDTSFLDASQQGVAADGAVVALLKSDDHHVLVSSNPNKLLEQFLPEQLNDEYVVTAQSLANYSDSEFSLLFGTFIPRSGTVATVARVLQIERKQRWIGALIFILMFSLLFVLVSVRLNRVLRRISDFARRALGMSELKVSRGNALFILEDWMREFSTLVLSAREEMRVKHEDQLRETEALKAAIMDTSLDSIITVDETGQIIDFNPTAEEIFGYQAEQAIGKQIAPLIISEQSRDSFARKLETCLLVPLEPGNENRTEMYAVRQDGTQFPVEIAIKPLLLKDSVLFTVYLHDISMRRRQQQEIRNLAAFPSESPMPILRINERGVIIYANQPSSALLEYWGVQFLQTLPAFWRKQVEDVLGKGREREIEVVDNDKFYSLLLVPIKGANYVNIYGKDVTETRNAEAESRQHQTDLVHVCRLSTMGEMATGIAHELNQPLSAIMNYASGCTRRLKLNLGGVDELLPALEQITTQAHRAGEIIKRMRGMLGKQPAIRDDTDLNSLVVEVCSFVEFELRKSEVKIELELEQTPLYVRVDLVQIEQVILNIVRNALDVLQEVRNRERHLLIKTGRKNYKTAFISIEDNGPGIPNPIMERLFDPFFTTKDAGMGMGLAISQTIIDDHQGSIRVESWPGSGTCFVIELPVSVSDEQSIAVAR
jgi:PAS domain S-box-containing protein